MYVALCHRYIWRSEGNSVGYICFSHLGWLNDKHLYLLSHPSGPEFIHFLLIQQDRERERETERDRDRDRDRERQRQRQTQTQKHRDRDREIESERDRETQRHRDRET